LDFKSPQESLSGSEGENVWKSSLNHWEK